MSMRLTKKQTEIYDFIKEFIAGEGYSPSYRDIMYGMGLTSVSAVAEHVNNLVALGALRKSPKAARSLEVVDLSFPETTRLFATRIKTATPGEKEVLLRAAAILGLDLDEESEDEQVID